MMKDLQNEMQDVKASADAARDKAQTAEEQLHSTRQELEAERSKQTQAKLEKAAGKRRATAMDVDVLDQRDEDEDEDEISKLLTDHPTSQRDSKGETINSVHEDPSHLPPLFSITEMYPKDAAPMDEDDNMQRHSASVDSPTSISQGQPRHAPLSQPASVFVTHTRALLSKPASPDARRDHQSRIPKVSASSLVLTRLTSN